MGDLKPIDFESKGGADVEVVEVGGEDRLRCRLCGASIGADGSKKKRWFPGYLEFLREHQKCRRAK